MVDEEVGGKRWMKKEIQYPEAIASNLSCSRGNAIWMLRRDDGVGGVGLLDTTS